MGLFDLLLLQDALQLVLVVLFDVDDQISGCPFVGKQYIAVFVSDLALCIDCDPLLGFFLLVLLPFLAGGLFVLEFLSSYFPLGMQGTSPLLLLKVLLVLLLQFLHFWPQCLINGGLMLGDEGWLDRNRGNSGPLLVLPQSCFALGSLDVH